LSNKQVATRKDAIADQHYCPVQTHRNTFCRNLNMYEICESSRQF